MKLIALAFQFAISLYASATTPKGLEVRVCPDSVLYVYEEIGAGSAKRLFTGVIQNIAFVNNSDETIILTDAIVKGVKDQVVIQTKLISKATLKKSAAKFFAYKKQGVLDLYDFQFQTSRYLAGVPLSASDTLKAGEAIIVMHEALLFDELPQKLVITLQGKNLKGKAFAADGQMRVENYQSKNKYIFPLKGRWMAGAGPSMTGHHRWASVQEFAFDFIKIGEGLSVYKNKGETLTDFYAYGEPVYAIGDGIVVSVLDGIDESSDNLKKEGEKEEEYFGRVRALQQKLMAKGFQYIYGNHVMIRHANAEYSTYLHLKNGSPAVKIGDVVKQGQKIGELGHSGNSTEPHLHFHVLKGPDMLYSRSIPVVFSNIVLSPDDDGNVRHLHSGQIVSTVN
jgi:murein DD-endopeptidase MepM/ murein hydrolase activator NlpD